MCMGRMAFLSGCVLLVLCPLLGVQGTLKESSFDGDSFLLRCGHHGLQFVLPLSPEGNTSAVLTVMDMEGVFYALQNDSACGIFMSQKPNGSVVIGAHYTGCYVSEKDGEYMITLGLERSLDGQQIWQEKQLTCPVLPAAMDAPSPDMCSGIGTADRMSCGSVPVTQSVCEEQGCCYNPSDISMLCYYGNPVTARCTQDGQAVIAVSKYIVAPSLNLDTMRLLTVTSACPDLKVNSNGVFLAYTFPLSCGSSYQVGDTTIYENRLEAMKDVRSADGWSITRDSTFRLTVRCNFTSSSFRPLKVEVFTLPPPLPVTSSGPLVLEMRIATDKSYRSYYTDSDYPVAKLLREPVYVEVRVLQRTDPNLVLVLNQCWATPSSNPEQWPQWPILVERCPYAGDNYRTQIVPVTSSMLQFPSHYQRFAVSTFTFVGNNQQSIQGLIYFHCSASVCVLSVLGSCSTVCTSRKRRMTEGLDLENMNRVTAEGPVNFETEEGALIPLEGSRGKEESMFPAAWRRGALVAAGLLTVALSVGLWKYWKSRQTTMVTVYP